jgi:hypothetical protein
MVDMPFRPPSPRRLWEWYRRALEDLRLRSAFVVCAAARCAFRDADSDEVGPRLLAPCQGVQRVSMCPCGEETCCFDPADAEYAGGGGRPTRRAAGCGRRGHEPLSCHARHVLGGSLRSIAGAVRDSERVEAARAAERRAAAAHQAAVDRRAPAWREADDLRRIAFAHMNAGWYDGQYGGFGGLLAMAVDGLREHGVRTIAMECAGREAGPSRRAWFAALLQTLVVQFRLNAADMGFGPDIGSRADSAVGEVVEAAEAEAEAAEAAVLGGGWPPSAEQLVQVLGRCGLDDARALVEAAAASAAAGGAGAVEMSAAEAEAATKRLVAKVRSIGPG